MSNTKTCSSPLFNQVSNSDEVRKEDAEPQAGPPENTMQRYMTVHVTCQNHVGYMTFNISDMHFDMSEHFEHVVCHDSTCNLPCSTTNEDVFAP